MAVDRTTAALRLASLAVLASLLVACATGEQTAEQAEQRTGRTFYPPEVCLGIYDWKQERTPEYWHIRRWCDQREMQDSRDF